MESSKDDELEKLIENAVSSGVSQEDEVEENTDSDDSALEEVESQEDEAFTPDEREVAEKQYQFNNYIERLRREQYKTEQENQQLKHRLNELQNVNFHQQNINYQQQGFALGVQEQLLKEQLEKATQRKKDAIDNADTDAQVKADLELIKINQDLGQLNILKSEEQQRIADEQLYAQQMQYQQSQAHPHDAAMRDWVGNNPWFFEGHPEYNPGLANITQTVMDNLKVKMYERGLQESIESRDYFELVNKSVRNIVNELQRENGLQMKQSQDRVSSVRNGSRNFVNRSRGQDKNYGLTAEQMELARTWKINPESYKKHLDRYAEVDKYKYPQR